MVEGDHCSYEVFEVHVHALLFPVLLADNANVVLVIDVRKEEPVECGYLLEGGIRAAGTRDYMAKTPGEVRVGVVGLVEVR